MNDRNVEFFVRSLYLNIVNAAITLFIKQKNHVVPDSMPML